MKRWTAIAANEDKHWSLLSEQLTRHGIANEFVPWTGPVDGWHQSPELAAFDHVRLGLDLNSDFLHTLKVQSSWITLLGVIDGMVKRDGVWWPLCALYESFGQILVALGTDMDMRGNVLVAGRGGIAKVAIAAFFKAGFSRFLLADPSEEEAQKTRNEVQRGFFGVQIHWVPREGVVLLPSETAVLVNCTGPDQSDLLTELSYLNFLRRPGFLFDTGLSDKLNLLTQEASDAGVMIIPGVDIAVRTDVLWAKWAFNVQIDADRYAKDLLSSLGT